LKKKRTLSLISTWRCRILKDGKKTTTKKKKNDDVAMDRSHVAYPRIIRKMKNLMGTTRSVLKTLNRICPYIN
jgi:hypothetical protein